MMVRAHDAPMSDDEWRALLLANDFAQFIAPGLNRELPVVVPTPYTFDGARTILLHFAKKNPVWAALQEKPLAMLSLATDYAYVPRAWNTNAGKPVEYGVPTEYYAAVQVSGPVRIVDSPDEIAAVLRAQMAVFEPEGGHAPIEPGENGYGAQLRHIRAALLDVRDVRAKFKFGGNKTREHQDAISARLAARASGFDLAAREHQQRRQG